MFIDPSGESLAVTLAIIFGVAGAIAGGTYLGIKAYNAGIEGWGLAGAIALGAIVGGIIGASMGFIVGTAIPGIGAFLGTTIPLFNTVTAAGELVAVSVTGAQLVAAGVGMLILWSTWQRGSWPGDDPTKAPDDGFEWRGEGQAGSAQGNWYHPKTGEILHPDLNHPIGIDPHWDFRDVFKKWWRIFRNGVYPK